MNIRSVLKLTTLILFVCLTAFGQKKSKTPPQAPLPKTDSTDAFAWKKKVARIIDMAQVDDTVHHHLHASGTDSSLAEMLIVAIKSGTLTAYSSWDANFSTMLSVNDIKEMVASKTDTVDIIDPMTGNQIEKVIRRDFNYDAAHKYRVLEEWSFNPLTGKTDVQITGLAPIIDVNGDDGKFRGTKVLFWVKYLDARKIIDRYEQYHPDNTIAAHIWYDYFQSDTMPAPVK